MAKMRFDTIRHAEQLRRMKECEEKQICYICDRIHKNKLIIHKGKHWSIIKNDFPYEGTVHHYLIVSNRHVVRMTELLKKEWDEKIEMNRWLEKKLKVKGFSEFYRNGNMMYTHASLDHLHFHFLVGTRKKQNYEKIQVTLGYKKTPR